MGGDTLRVLVGCEYSGVVRRAFSTRGHDAWSCDLLDTEDGSFQHIKGDVLDAVHSGPWDLIILHPPCTYLSVSGNRWYGIGTAGEMRREEALIWTERLWEAAVSRCSHVCLENPVGVLSRSTLLPRPQYVQPWQFGHGETKKTGLWLHGLPPLVPTKVVDGREQRIWKMPPGERRGLERSRTYTGIAEAMASQWSKYITEEAHQ